MLKNIINKIFNKNKYACNCCGYITLPTNNEYEICPICRWQEEYFCADDCFPFSYANHMTLYEAQENYKKFKYYSNRALKYCRKPKFYEEKDSTWISIQEIIENKFNSIQQLIGEIDRVSENLKQPEAKIIFEHFKSLREINILSRFGELNQNLIDFYENEFLDQFENELMLKSLFTALCKLDPNRSLKTFEEYYKQGLSFYIAWSIMLIVLIDLSMCTLEPITEIILDIENNNYYGMESLKEKLAAYWINSSK